MNTQLKNPKQANLQVEGGSLLALDKMGYNDPDECFLSALFYKLATVTDETSLTEIIDSQVKRLLFLKQFTILRIKNSKSADYHFTNFNPLMAHVDHDNVYVTPTSFENFFCITDEYKIFDKKQFITTKDPFGYVSLWFSDDADRGLGIPIWLESKLIAILFVWPDYVEHFINCYESHHFPGAFIKQLTNSLLNISLKDEAVSRDKQRISFSLNLNIAAAGNSYELSDAISRNLKNYLGFENNLIVTINDDNLNVQIFLSDCGGSGKPYPLHSNEIDLGYAIDDKLLEKSVHSNLPVVLDLNDLPNLKQSTFYRKKFIGRDTRRVVVCKLCHGGEVFGFWMLFFNEGQKLNCRKIEDINEFASILSIAVSNMRATRDIQKRDFEKELSISIFNAMISIKDRSSLAKTLGKKLSEVFRIQDFIVHIYQADKSEITPFLFVPGGSLSSDDTTRATLENSLRISDSVYHQVIQDSDIISFNLLDLLDGYEMLPPHVNFNLLTSTASFPLRMGSAVVGILTCLPDNNIKLSYKDVLFNAICLQLAIITHNMLAKEQSVNQITEIKRLQNLLEPKTHSTEDVRTNCNVSEIIGTSLFMKEVFDLIAKVSPSDTTVLLLGETGTGKELVAKAIHDASPRRDKIMVKVNCAALPANLIESELFGHEKGSFTGATSRRIGKFELADGGTLFLDEIGEISPLLQAKLLRMLQEREIERIGGRSVIKINVRIIAATNRDIESEINTGKFRKDLFYRLNVFPILLPPLRNRKEDIPALVVHFIKRLSEKTGKKITKIETELFKELEHHSWPGNIRELEHVIERSMLQTTGDVIKHILLPAPKLQISPGMTVNRNPLIKLYENERLHILSVLKHCNGKIAGKGGASEILGIPSSTLNSKMKKLGIRRLN